MQEVSKNGNSEREIAHQAIIQGRDPLAEDGVTPWEDQVGIERIVNRRIIELDPLPTPAQVLSDYPLSRSSSDLILRSRRSVREVLRGQDDRLLVIVGPCSIHDPKAALDYAHRLADVNQRLADRLLIVMRVYFEKPRTTVG